MNNKNITPVIIGISLPISILIIALLFSFSKADHAFEVGSMVEHRIDGRRGMVVMQFHGNLRYRVRFSVSDSNRKAPYAIVNCAEFELIKSDNN